MAGEHSIPRACGNHNFFELGCIKHFLTEFLVLEYNAGEYKSASGNGHTSVKIALEQDSNIRSSGWPDNWYCVDRCSSPMVAETLKPENW